MLLYARELAKLEDRIAREFV